MGTNLNKNPESCVINGGKTLMYFKLKEEIDQETHFLHISLSRFRK